MPNADSLKVGGNILSRHPSKSAQHIVKPHARRLVILAKRILKLLVTDYTRPCGAQALISCPRCHRRYWPLLGWIVFHRRKPPHHQLAVVWAPFSGFFYVPKCGHGLAESKESSDYSDSRYTNRVFDDRPLPRLDAYWCRTRLLAAGMPAGGGVAASKKPGPHAVAAMPARQTAMLGTFSGFSVRRMYCANRTRGTLWQTTGNLLKGKSWCTIEEDPATSARLQATLDHDARSPAADVAQAAILVKPAPHTSKSSEYPSGWRRTL